MSKKHHAIYSDPTGAAAAASPARRRSARTKPANPVAESTSPAAEQPETRAQIVDRDAIARLAYSYWEARGFVGGTPEEDWLRAESEIRSSHAASAIA